MSFIQLLNNYVFSGIPSNAAYDLMKYGWKRWNDQSLEDIFVQSFQNAFDEMKPTFAHHAASDGDITFDTQRLRNLLAQGDITTESALMESNLTPDDFIAQISEVFSEQQILIIGGHQLTPDEYEQLVTTFAARAQANIRQAIREDESGFKQVMQDTAEELYGQTTTANSALQDLAQYLREDHQIIINQLDLLEELIRETNERVGQLAERTEHTPATEQAKRTIRVFISSPGDVHKERRRAKATIRRLNADPILSQLVHLEAISWDQSIPFTAATSPQDSVNQHLPLPSECDIVAVIFWSRMGTPVPPEMGTKPDGSPYLSGTEWEYHEAVRGFKHHQRPQILVYRREEVPSVQMDDPNMTQKLEQYRLVQEFFDTFKNPDGSMSDGYNIYQDPDDFERWFEIHLKKLIVHLIEDPTPPPPKPKPPPTVSIDTFDHKAMLESYLHWLLDLHSTLELRGIGGDVHLPTIPLEKVYVALKAEIEAPLAKIYDIEQSHKELNANVQTRLDDAELQDLTPQERQQFEQLERNRALAQAPVPTMLERDRPNQAHRSRGKRINLGDAFQRERWLVILGDPGSGKTTLSRWLTLKLAQTLLDDLKSDDDTTGARLRVPRHQVDPDIEPNSPEDTVVDLGEARVPILVRVSDYARANVSQLANDAESLPLSRFIGCHPWQGEKPHHGGSPLSEEQLNALFLHYLREGKAVVILDGMDEITSTIQRENVVHMIENFIQDWINGHGKYLSSEHVTQRWDELCTMTPVEDGGNQIVITSRIAGYHRKPISANGRLTHVEILPMEKKAVNLFCDSWTLAVQRVMNPSLDDDALQMLATSEATKLKNAIYDPSRPRVQELATNPLLITILALVYRKYEQQLPQQRTDLYQTALEIFINEWRNTGLSETEITYVLSPLAAHIHETNAQGYIASGDMRDVIAQHLAEYRALPDPKNPPPSFEEDIDKFLTAMQQQVGILAERGEMLYGFLHLTFQEYLAALWLIRDDDEAAEKIIARLSDPRWREPILMALGYTSDDKNWGEKRQLKLLSALLQKTDPTGLNTLIPRGALLIVSALKEMKSVPNQILQDAADRLIHAYADRKGIGRYKQLQTQIEQAFSILRSYMDDAALEHILEHILVHHDTSESDIILAVAVLVRKQQWFTPKIIHALIQRLPEDNVRWNFPIHATLQDVIARQAIEYFKENDIPEFPDPPSGLSHLKAQYAALKRGQLEAYVRQEIERLNRLIDSSETTGE